VADFIGSVNMFEGRITEDAPDHVRIASPELGTTIFVDHGVSAPPEATVWVAVRPEKMELARERPAQEENIVRGVVKEIAYLGDVSRYLVLLNSGKQLRITQPNLYRHEERITWDEDVWVYWDPSANVVVTQ
jgi:putrescine transport system ATP-binding protein